MLSLTARTAFASLSATKLSARRLVVGSERLRRLYCWRKSLKARSVASVTPLISSERIMAFIADATELEAASASDISMRIKSRPLISQRVR
eukprot:1685487-Pleurochrysis_carterae.AAC.1